MDIYEKLEKCKGHWKLVSKISGVNAAYIGQIHGKHVRNPGLQTVMKLESACDQVIKIVVPLQQSLEKAVTKLLAEAAND